MQYLNKENYKQKTSSCTCVVTFKAPWCRDCVVVAPMLEKLEAELGDKISFFAVDFDKEESLKDELNIRRIPTLIFYKDCKEVNQRLVEPHSLEAIRKELMKLI